MTNTDIFRVARRMLAPYTTDSSLIPVDDEREVGIITHVAPAKDGTGWWITYGFSCFMSRLSADQPAPGVGDEFTVYLRGGPFGSFHGQALNGRVIWYRTQAMMDYRWNLDRVRQFNASVLDSHLKDKKARPLLAPLYDELPPFLQLRVNASERVNAEKGRCVRPAEMYFEMRMLKAAAEVVKVCPTEEEIRAYAELPVSEQFRLVPFMADLGHSGTSFHYTLKVAIALANGRYDESGVDDEVELVG